MSDQTNYDTAPPTEEERIAHLAAQWFGILERQLIQINREVKRLNSTLNVTIEEFKERLEEERDQ